MSKMDQIKFCIDRLGEAVERHADEISSGWDSRALRKAELARKAAREALELAILKVMM